MPRRLRSVSCRATRKRDVPPQPRRTSISQLRGVTENLDQAGEDVVSADSTMAQQVGLLLGQNQHVPCPVGKPLKHEARVPAAFTGHSSDPALFRGTKGLPGISCARTLWSPASRRSPTPRPEVS
jgi:hypothetical protein